MTEKLDQLISVVEGLSIRLATIEEAMRNDRHLRFKIKATSSEFLLVIRVVAQVFEVSEASLLANRRMEKIAAARQVAMALAMKFLKTNFSETGRLFKRDHATVAHADRVVDGRRSVDKDFRRKYSTAEQLIKLHLQAHHERSIQPPTVPGSTTEPIPQGAGHTKIPSSLGEVDRSP